MLLNDAVRSSLAEDTEDLEAFELRAKEPVIGHKMLVKTVKRRGKL